MIEFLDDSDAWKSSVEDYPGNPYVGNYDDCYVSLNYWFYKDTPKHEMLCDALWSALKEILEKE